MSPLDSRKTKTALLKKGFVQYNNDHKFFEFIYNNKVITKTKISHNDKDIEDYLINQMAHQTKLNKGQFKQLIECTIDKEQYISILKENGEID